MANKIYKIEINGDYQTAALTTGGSIGFVMTTGAASIKGNVRMQTNNSTLLAVTNSIFAISNSGTLNGSFITSTGVNPVGVPHNIHANLILFCSTSGVFQVQWGSNNANSSVLNSNTTMIVTVLN